MHPALSVAEIRRQIVNECFAATHKEACQEDYAAVAMLARTSRAFSEPALDVLWYAQLGLGNLIKCMPSDAWAVETKDHMEYVTLRRTILPTDWMRFHVYAQRVRILAFNLADIYDDFSYIPKHTAVDIHVLTMLALYRPVSLILPNLHSFYWEHHYRSHGAWVRPPRSSMSATIFDPSAYGQLFLRPGLRHLSLSVRQSFDSTTVSLLAHIESICTDLRHLDIDILALNGSHPDVLSLGNLCSFRALQTLTLNTYDIPIPLLELSRLPHLTKLRLGTLKGIAAPETQKFLVSSQITGACDICFTTLQTLKLTTAPSACAQAIALSQFPALREVEIWILDEPISNQSELHPVIRLLRALDKGCCYMSLSSLTVQDSISYRRESVVETVDPGIPMLGRLTSLTALVMAGDTMKLANDSSVMRLARACPRLRSIELYGPVPSSLTLLAICHIVAFCPDLEELGITLNASINNFSIERRPGGGHVNTAITCVKIAQSALSGDLAKVAAFLSDLFPNLREIKGGGPRAYSLLWFSEWKKVEKMLPTFHAVRGWGTHGSLSA